LCLTRRETAEFCQYRGIIPWQDPTNGDRRFARSRIRQDVIPYLQAHLNPQVETTLAQTAEVLQAEVAYLEAEAAQLLQQAWEKSTLGLQRSLLAQAPLALQRRALRQFLQQQLATQVTFEQVEKLVKLVNAPNRSQTDPFPGGAIARVEGEYLRL
jgi:tRNA(Ile)-lysidine synthase